MKMNIAGAIIVAGTFCATVSVAAAQGGGPRVYVAHLHSLNAGAAGSSTSGVARFTVSGDSLAITVDVRNAPANMEHLQHFHGFTDGRDATCPAAGADANGDGVVDLMETEPTSGTTMVPFTADPVSMEVVTDTYPHADASGSYHYSKTVSLAALEKAFAGKFPGQQLDLTKRVVYIHGVPSATKLPSTAASLGTIPAQVTLPIACGAIEVESR